VPTESSVVLIHRMLDRGTSRPAAPVHWRKIDSICSFQKGSLARARTSHLHFYPSGLIGCCPLRLTFLAVERETDVQFNHGPQQDGNIVARVVPCPPGSGLAARPA